jgi:hypothetical protein
VTIPKDPTETVTILGKPQQSDPRAIRVAEEALRGGERAIRMNLNFGYVERRSVVGLLRAAYLLMFRTFGYSYVLDRSGRALRRQIMDPFDDGPFLTAIMWQVEEKVPAGSFIAVAREAAATACFVVLELADNPRDQAAVALPPPAATAPISTQDAEWVEDTPSEILRSSSLWTGGCFAFKRYGNTLRIPGDRRERYGG